MPVCAPANNTGAIAATDTTPHTAILVNPFRAGRFHRRATGTFRGTTYYLTGGSAAGLRMYTCARLIHAVMLRACRSASAPSVELRIHPLPQQTGLRHVAVAFMSDTLFFTNGVKVGHDHAQVRARHWQKNICSQPCAD